MIDLTNFTREGFTEWLARQVPERQFFYMSCQECMIASWLKESGICPNPHVGGSSFADVDQPGLKTNFPGWLDRWSEWMSEINHTYRPGFTVQQFKERIAQTR